LTVFALPPLTSPARIVTCNFELVSDTIAHFIFGGITKPFQVEFVRAGVDGKRVKLDPDEQYGEYYHVMKELNLTKSKVVAAELTTMFDHVLHGSPVVLRVKATAHDTKSLKDVFTLLVADNKQIRIDNCASS